LIAFSPVEKMQLVEVIVKETSKTLAAAIDYVTAIGKVPLL
jgi:3-hydroxyacyl-CoA dehydrogenase